jgi:hypothetical protein
MRYQLNLIEGWQQIRTACRDQMDADGIPVDVPDAADSPPSLRDDSRVQLRAISTSYHIRIIVEDADDIDKFKKPALEVYGTQLHPAAAEQIRIGFKRAFFTWRIGA